MNDVSPGDTVTWFKGKEGGDARGAILIKAEVWYRLKKKWAIRFQNKLGETCVRYVEPEQIEKGLRPGVKEFF